MERTKGVTIYAVLIIIYGAFNLLGSGNFSQFSMMFKPLAAPVILAAYVFTILYGVCGVYCGIRMLKLDEWARKAVVIMTAISVITGFFMTRTAMANYKEFILSGEAGVPAGTEAVTYNYVVAFIILATLFELSIVFFLTRPNVVNQFKQ